MNIENIYLLIDDDTYFARHLAFKKIDFNLIVDYFEKNSLLLKVIRVSDLVYQEIEITNSLLFITSSQKPYHKNFLLDYFEFLKHNNNILIPSIDAIKMHENKGYQELYKKIKKIPSLKSYYLNNDVFLEENLKDFSFPIVLKEVYGSGSRGVYLVNNFYELENKIKKQEVHMGVRFFIFVKEFFLSFFPFFRNKEKEAYFKDYYNYVVQEYVPDLAFDYKVLVFFDKYYVLKRFIRTNDFRASGSGNFEFSEVEDSLLDYVLSVFEKLNEPFMSFDVCFDGRDYCLIELQGIHFGPYTQLNSSGYYTKKKNRWEFVDDKTSFECDIAYALYSYIKEGGLIG